MTMGRTIQRNGTASQNFRSAMDSMIRRAPARPEPMAKRARLSGIVCLLIAILIGAYSKEVWIPFLNLEFTEQILCIVAILLPLLAAIIRPAFFDIYRLGFGLLFYLAYLALVQIPSISVYDHLRLPEFFVGVCLGSICVSIPIIVLGRKPFQFQTIRKSEIPYIETAIAFMWAFCLLGLILYFLIVDHIPLFALGRYRLEQLTDLREESMKLLPMPLFLYFQGLRYFGFLCLVALSLGHSLVTSSIWSKISFLLALFLGVTFSAFSLAKGPPLIMLMTTAAMYIFIKRKITASTIVLVFVAFFVPPLIAWIMTPENSLATLAADLFYRRTLELVSEVCYFYFAAFPEGSPRLWGESIYVVQLITGYDGVQLPNYIYRFMNHGSVDSGWANSVFVGAAWVDFGYAGIVWQSLLVGYLIVKLQYYFGSYRSISIIDLPFVVFVGFFFACLSIQSLFGTFFLASVPTCLLVHYLLRKRLDRLSNNIGETFTPQPTISARVRA